MTYTPSQTSSYRSRPCFFRFLMRSAASSSSSTKSAVMDHLSLVCIGHSRRQAVAQPKTAVAAIADTVVQPVVAPLPELEHLGNEPIAAPVRRAGHFAAGEAPFQLGEAFFQDR